MKRSMLAVTALAFSLTTFTPAQAGFVGSVAPVMPSAKTSADSGVIHKVGRRWRRGGRGAAIGAGIITLGILGAIAASRRAKARDYDYYEEEERYYEHRDRCERWRRACRNGHDRACWRFDTRC